MSKHEGLTEGYHSSYFCHLTTLRVADGSTECPRDYNATTMWRRTDSSGSSVEGRMFQLSKLFIVIVGQDDMTREHPLSILLLLSFQSQLIRNKNKQTIINTESGRRIHSEEFFKSIYIYSKFSFYRAITFSALLKAVTRGHLQSLTYWQINKANWLIICWYL